jgi:hypothetical protein
MTTTRATIVATITTTITIVITILVIITSTTTRVIDATITIDTIYYMNGIMTSILVHVDICWFYVEHPHVFLGFVHERAHRAGHVLSRREQ